MQPTPASLGIGRGSIRAVRARLAARFDTVGLLNSPNDTRAITAPTIRVGADGDRGGDEHPLVASLPLRRRPLDVGQDVVGHGGCRRAERLLERPPLLAGGATAVSGPKLSRTSSTGVSTSWCGSSAPSAPSRRRGAARVSRSEPIAEAASAGSSARRSGGQREWRPRRSRPRGRRVCAAPAPRRPAGGTAKAVRARARRRRDQRQGTSSRSNRCASGVVDHGDISVITRTKPGISRRSLTARLKSRGQALEHHDEECPPRASEGSGSDGEVHRSIAMNMKSAAAPSAIAPDAWACR